MFAVAAVALVGASSPVVAAAGPDAGRGGTPEFGAGEAASVATAPSITIVENAVADAPQDFSFTGCQGAGCGPFVLDDDEDPALSNIATASGLTPGVYTITQAPGVNHWMLDDIFCDTGEDPDVDNRTVTITLGAAENVTCTFLNRSPSIKIIQDAAPDAPQDFSFTGCQGAGCGPFSLDDDNDPGLSNSVTGAGLAPGTYTITQAETPGWPLQSLSCNTGETVDLENRTVTVTLGSTEFTRCTFTNRSNGIKIVQDTAPDDPTDFGYTGCLGSGCAHFDLDDDNDPTLPNSTSAAGITPGVYTITQDAVPGYDLLNLTCDGYAEVDLAGRRVTIVMDGDQAINCTFSNRPTPTSLTEVAAISAGLYHTCARLENGQARCWGSNEYGQLGDGTTTSRNQATVVSNADGTGPLTGVAQISVGGLHTCATLTNGQARCWGLNADGQLGDASNTSRLRATTVLSTSGSTPLAGIAEITTGFDHTCARLLDGEARCWGRGSEGQLGDGAVTDRFRPVVVSNPDGTGPLTGVAQISAGGFHTCARLLDGEARCWGDNVRGALGDGTTLIRARPVVVLNSTGSGALSGVSEIGAGAGQTCARLTRQVRCWGMNEYGQLGDGASDSQAHPVPVTVVDVFDDEPLTQVVQLSVGAYHACARLTSGQARCWGSGGDGQLGVGEHYNWTWQPRPVVVSNPDGTGPLTDVAQISAGYDHSCARLLDGEARCWGLNYRGALGDGTDASNRDRPVTVFTF